MYPRVHAESTPDKIAIVMGGGATVTYRELEERSNQLAHLCRERGLGPGAQVSIWAENNPRYYEVYWAAMRSGLYLTGINRLATPEEAAYILEDSDTRVLITSWAMRERARAAAAPVPGMVLLMFDGVADGFESYEEALATQPVTPLPEEPRGEVMLYSSGTTGRPKGIRRPLSGVDITDPSCLRTSQFGEFMLGMNSDSIYLMPAPLYHAAGLMWSSGTHELGGTVVAMEKFDAEEMLRLIEEHRITHIPGRPDDDGAPAEAARRGPREVRRLLAAVLRALGRALPGRRQAADDRVARPDRLRVLRRHREQRDDLHQLRGPAGPPRSDGRPVLGTLHICDADGYLYLTDRKSFTIISGGANVYPAEIESRLIMHPRVSDVVVFGLPDPDMGESVHAVVEPAAPGDDGQDLVEELQGLCA